MLRLKSGRIGSLAASGTSIRNVDGEAVSITVFSTVKSWGLLELPLFFLFVRLRKNSLNTLKELSFIHAARWSLLRRLPANGDQPEIRLRFPHLYFESNFNGGWEEYIDAFSYVLTTGMWGSGAAPMAFRNALPIRSIQAIHQGQRIQREPLLLGVPGSDKHHDSLGARDRPEARDAAAEAGIDVAGAVPRGVASSAHGGTVVPLNNNKVGKMYALTVFTPIITARLGELRAFLDGLHPNPVHCNVSTWFTSRVG